MSARIFFSASMVACMMWTPVLYAADAAAGKAIAQAKCASCHEPADWEGETDAGLQSLVKDVVSGKVKHSKTKVELNDQEISNVVAYWLSAKKK